ncbi:MAG: hypothetical protein JW996_01485 [Candidatus Cloacimonetes bacterium]|nr:hypothetical protein [Candidatus Cloacimonadota bacterium]
MASILDALGAVIIGGLLLLTMMASLFNLQGKAIDIEQQVILAEVSESVAGIISEYLAVAGAGQSAQILSGTGDSRLTFTGSNSTYTSALNTYDIRQDSVTTLGFPLSVFIDNFRVLGPFFLSDSLRFFYFDDALNSISTVNGNIANENLHQIRSVRMEMEFFYDAFAPDSLAGPDRKDPKNRIVMWQYLNNMYLN